MKRHLQTILLAVILCGTASGQSDFINGYIIKNDGSYTHGQLKYIAKGYAAKECRFKWFDISAEYNFKPGDIAAFGFEHGMRYKSVTSGKWQVFMACLTSGDLDLLFDGKRLYLDGMGLEMVPLDNKAGNVNAEGKTVSFNGYADLIEKLPDPENKFTVPRDISLEPEKMAEVIAGYNRSRGNDAKIFAIENSSDHYEEMRNLGAYMYNYGIIAGMNASKYDATKPSSRQTEFIPEMDFFELTPVFGFFINRPVSRKSDRFFIQAEIMAFKTNVYMYDETESFRGITRSDINLSYTGIKVPLYLRINLLKGSIKPFINAGGFGMVNMGAKFTLEGQIEDNQHIVRPSDDKPALLKGLMFGGLAGIGIKKDINPKKSFYLEIRAESATGIYDRQGLHQKTISFNIIAGFDFL